ncbi:alpha-(1-_3)-arabinofuranosyltransferase [Aeromicrobium panaciterrae]
MFLVVCVLQSPGRLVGDTKADLTIDPVGFMERAFHMWDASGFAGQVQNQAYGYLFPMGPFFALFDVLHLPEWVAQRVWWAALLSIAFLGAHRLLVALDIGTSWSRYVGALSYALAPRILGVLGAASVEGYPAALTPWVLVPLVTVASGRGKGLARAAALSALAVGLMGGVNGAVNLAAVLPAVLWFLTRRWDRTVAKLAAWWALFVATATLWWVVPLLMLGRFSPDFLDYIETAAETTRVTNLIETVRGTSHWVGFISGGFGSPWQIGADLVSSGALIANTVVVAGAGLLGVMLLRSAERLWVVTCLLVGVAMVTFGHLSTVEGWFAESQNAALDGALSPLRNVHKFDVLIRLALSIGVVSLLSRFDLRRAWAERDIASVLWPGIVALAVVGVASTAVIGRLGPSDSYASVPTYWSETGKWLDDHPNGRALLAPGARFGRYIWGTTNDEILQALTSSEWEVRNTIPLTPAGHIRMLDSIERQFAAGQPSPGFADYLARQGFGYVVVRHDLSGAEAHTRTGFVEQVLSQSPGFTIVKRLGPVIDATSQTATLNDANLSPPRHAVEIWAVGTTTPDRASLTSVSDASVVSGDSQSLLDLADDDQLPSGATIMSGDLAKGGAVPSGPSYLTDSYRRREVSFGRIGNNQSSTMTARDLFTLGRKFPDYVPYSVSRHGSQGEWVGVRSVVASSSLSDADSFGVIRQDRSVRAMFDGDSGTFWSTLPETIATPQTVTITLDDPIAASRVSVRMRAGDGPDIRRIAAQVDGEGTLLDAEQSTTDPDVWTIDIDRRVTSKLQLRFTRSDDSLVPVRVAELSVDDLPIRYRVATPDDIVGGPDVVLATNTAGYHDGCVRVTDEPTHCSPGVRRGGEDDHGVQRSFMLERGGTFTVTARAAMRPGDRVNSIYRKLATGEVTAEASSSALDLVDANSFALVDGDPGTTWVASFRDDAPSISVKLGEQRTVSSLRFVYADRMAASRPASVVVTIGRHSYRRLVPPDGHVDFPATKATSFKLEFTGDERTATADAATGELTFLNIGISEILVDGGVASNPPLTKREIVAPCGVGPRVQIDDVIYETSVAAPSEDLLAGRPVDLTLCGGSAELSPGMHDMTLLSDDAWRPTQVALTRAGSGPSTVAGAISLSPTRWTDDDRKVPVPQRDEVSYLAVNENINAGWVAKLHGKKLDPVTIDGWKQGFVVPAGAAGVVTLTYVPSTIFSGALLAGFVLLGLLAVLALLLGRRRPERSIVIRAAQSRVAQSLLVMVGLGLIGGTVGAAIGTVAVLVTLAARRFWFVSPVAAGLLVVGFGVAGALVVVRRAGGVGDYLGDRPVTQILVLAALAIACAPWPSAQRWKCLNGASSTR